MSLDSRGRAASGFTDKDNGGKKLLKKFEDPPESVEEILQDKKNELTEWIAGRLQESAWIIEVKNSLKNKLDSYPDAQIFGQEKKLVDELCRSVGPDVRNSLPDTVKMDLVKAVQDILGKDDEILKCFRTEDE